MEIDKLTAEVVRFMLFKSHKQPNVPVKREELAQLITENYKQRSLPGTVIANAQARLKSIFGLEMVEVHLSRQTKASKNAASQAPAGDVKVYVLKSLVPEELAKRFIETKDIAAPMGFAVVVVGVLQLAGDKVPEGTLWTQLKRMGIDEFDNSHPVFGNIKENIQTLVKQRYIRKEKVSSSEGDVWVLDLAERALDEIFKKELVNNAEN
ncbi:uncharacterized protein [Physcomitrium patens]|uniref:uncharacterized protein isoform X2 n=1 Tax=Physcomitrium patens TaxID=3218 RepID=UPI000D1542CD|nr:melanoma-associated antigen 1-like isoform X2 [Physcomitrium patens]|eukprot:XP_024396132.1 melanoma-associated antigen 1-like isoform X2 [Physcomitrella patens]